MPSQLPPKADVNSIKASGNAPISIEIPHETSWQEKEQEVAEAVSFLLIEKLKDAITELLDKHTDHQGLPKAWSISHSSDKWGYCTPEGNIGFHWQLICCPKSVLEYVVVHELAHLKERSHTEKFWSLVRSILPNYELQKKWLEVEGSRICANFEP